MKEITFSKAQTSFFKELKEEVNSYFVASGKQKTGDARLYVKTGLILSLYAGLYIVLIAFDFPWYIGLFLAAFFGFLNASIGFNIMHDACHGSFSSRKWVNELFSLSMNLIGSNAFIWKQKHNVIHHTYTNVDGLDDDIAKSPLFRMAPAQPRKWAHRFQHIYMFPLYGISTIFWAFGTDFNKYLSGRIYRTKLWNMSLQEHLIFWLSKVYYVVVYFVIPLYFKGFWAWLPGYLMLNLVFGIWMSVVFQLAHVVETTDFEHVDYDGQTKELEEWAIHQVHTTADFAPRNRIINYLVGGLNFQVEHHLFPHVSHVHYPSLQPIVMKLCEAHGIRYNCFPTFNKAFVSHVRVMREFGRQG